MRSDASKTPSFVLRQGLVERPETARIAAELRNELSQELDLEQVLRRALEAIHRAVGPTNVVIFLPAADGGYVLGGYMNYNMERCAAAVLLPHMVEVAAPVIAGACGPMHLTENDEMYHWLRDDGAWLEDMQLVGLPCRDGRELMAGMMLFRDNREPFGAEGVQTLEILAAVLAVHLTKVIGVHHRWRGFLEDERV